MDYYGEQPCSNQKCKNMAYYKRDDKLFCGVHCRDKQYILIKNPNAKQMLLNLLNERQERVDSETKRNYIENKYGNVVCTKLRMRKKPEHIDGYLKVFPNYEHNERQDGFGCSALSPKSLGPVVHNEKNVPIALNLENYHQFAKCYQHELDDMTKFYNARDIAYQSNTPHRHKHHKMRPIYSIHVNSQGIEKHFTYLESRYFYCYYYEKLAKETKEYAKLVELIASGTNIQIVGYDAYPVSKTLMEHYLDISKPFGHELVLYTMLVCKCPTSYPWNIYYHKHVSKYIDFF